MKYDFTSTIDRSDAYALCAIGAVPGFAPDVPGEGFDVIPMWVADMNFAVPPSVTQALVQRASEPTFGYFFTKKEYYQSIVKWHRERNQVQGLTPECIGYQNGVLGGVVSALRVLCSMGDKVLLHSPTYIGFTGALQNNGYKIVHSPLYIDEAGKWRMDYEDMEQKIVKEHIHTAILCSPHNPTGRVWEREELEQAMELFRRHDVFVISDEIWSDLTLEGYQHIPTQSVSEDARMRTAAFYAPSKTFNLAGLVGAYHIIYNPWLRERIDKESSLAQYNEMGVMSMYAAMSAYQPENYQWVDELRQVLTGNALYACDYIEQHFPGVTAQRPEGTYMLFVDCSKWCEDHGKTIEDVERACWQVGVAVQDGRMFHGACHLRMNLALPFARLQEAFERMRKYVF